MHICTWKLYCALVVPMQLGLYRSHICLEPTNGLREARLDIRNRNCEDNLFLVGPHCLTSIVCTCCAQAHISTIVVQMRWINPALTLPPPRRWLCCLISIWTVHERLSGARAQYGKGERVCFPTQISHWFGVDVRQSYHLSISTAACSTAKVVESLDAGE